MTSICGCSRHLGPLVLWPGLRWIGRVVWSGPVLLLIAHLHLATSVHSAIAISVCRIGSVGAGGRCAGNLGFF